MQNRYKRLGKNTFWVFIGRAGSSIISMLMLPFYTHWLSSGEYGTYDLINTYSMILTGLISCSIADSIFIFPKNADEQGRTKYYSSGYLFVFVTTCCFALFMWLLQLIGGKLSWSGVFFEKSWFILAFAVCQFIQQYSQSFTRSIDRMRIYSYTGVIFTGSIALFSFYLLPRYGLNGYLYAIIFANLLSSGFTILASGSHKYISLVAFDRKYLVELLKYGIPLFPNGLMWWLVNSMNRPVMESYLGLEAVGLYSVAHKFPSMLSILVNVFGTAWSITMLEEFGKPDFNHFFNRTIKMLYFVMIVGCCMIAALSKIIVMIFADSSYFEAWKYIPVLTFSIVMQLLSTNVGGVFMAEKKSKYFFYSSIWGALASLIATLGCIKLWGLQGAAIAVAFSCFVMVVARMVYAWKHINEMPIWWYVIMTLLCLLFIIVVVIDLPLYINIPIYLVILTVICFLSRDVLKPVFETAKGLIVKKLRNEKNSNLFSL